MKYRPIKINIKFEHYDELLEKAQANEQTIAEFVRKELGIDLGIKPRTRKKRTDSSEFNKADPALLYQLAKIGNNLNQIAKACNSKNDDDIQIMQSLIQIRNEIQKVQK